MRFLKSDDDVAVLGAMAVLYKSSFNRNKSYKIAKKIEHSNRNLVCPFLGLKIYYSMTKHALPENIIKKCQTNWELLWKIQGAGFLSWVGFESKLM